MRILLLCLLLFTTLGLPVRADSNDSEDRQRAQTLVFQAKFSEAIPLLRKLTAAHPKEGQLWTWLGLSLHTWSGTLNDAGPRKQARIEAREALLKAQQLGVHEELVDAVVATIPADGSGGEQGTLSANPEVNRLLTDAEKAFAKGDFLGAEQGYSQAFALAPTLYDAPLYAGDSCFRAGQNARAQEWLAKAVTVDPQRETAYRYWGDVLLKEGKTEEARAKFIEGVVAEPYARFSWAGLANWAKAAKVQVGHPRFTGLDSSGVKLDGGNVTIYAQAGGDATMLISSYALGRTVWHAQNPEVKRHCLAEEAMALNGVAQMGLELSQSGKLKSKPIWLDELVRLQQLNLMEAYVLLGRPDQGISEDYPAYRQAHRDLLVKYLREVYTQPTSAPSSDQALR